MRISDWSSAVCSSDLILRIDDLSSSGHLEHVLRERGTEGEVAGPEGARHRGAVRLPDQAVVADPAAVGVERLAGPQDDEVTLAPALVDEEDRLAQIGRAHV